MPGPRRSRDGPSGITDRTLVWGQAGNSTSLQWATSSDSFVAGTTAGVLVHVPAPTVHRVVDSVGRVVDSVGAGDTFIAATLVVLSQESATLVDVLGAEQCGVLVASAGVAQEGMSGLSMPPVTACAKPAAP